MKRRVICELPIRANATHCYRNCPHFDPHNTVIFIHGSTRKECALFGEVVLDLKTTRFTRHLECVRREVR